MLHINREMDSKRWKEDDLAENKISLLKKGTMYFKKINKQFFNRTK